MSTGAPLTPRRSCWRARCGPGGSPCCPAPWVSARRRCCSPVCCRCCVAASTTAAGSRAARRRSWCRFPTSAVAFRVGARANSFTSSISGTRRRWTGWCGRSTHGRRPRETALASPMRCRPRTCRPSANGEAARACCSCSITSNCCWKARNTNPTCSGSSRRGPLRCRRPTSTPTSSSPSMITPGRGFRRFAPACRVWGCRPSACRCARAVRCWSR